MRGGPIEGMCELLSCYMKVEAEDYTDVCAVAFKNSSCTPERTAVAVVFCSVLYLWLSVFESLTDFFIDHLACMLLCVEL